MRTLIKPDNYLYVAELSDGVVKIGRTCDVARRFNHLRRELQKAGMEPAVRKSWVSDPTSYAGAWHVETALIALCRANWPTAQGNEYFTAPFDAVVELTAATCQARRAAPPAVMYRRPKPFPRNKRTAAA